MNGNAVLKTSPFKSQVCRTACLLVTALALAGCAKGPREPEGSSSPLRVRLMTAKQYSQTLANIFGPDVSASVTAPLPPLTRTDGLLESGAAFIGVTSDQLQQIHETASFVAAKVVDEQHRDFLIPCKPASDKAADAACATTFLRQVGRLWYRRPVDDAKLTRLAAAAGSAADQQKDFYAGLASVLEAMLISPEALFIVDAAEPRPDKAGHRRLEAYSIASRLSFLLWNSAPDDALLRAAESGDLKTKAGLTREVDRMLSSARLEEGVRAFFDDMLGFNDFDSIAKDPVKYPVVTGATLADAREQTLRTVVDHLIVRKEDYRDLFTTRSTFMSMNLAAVYGVPSGNGWRPYEFAEGSPRAGLLMQVAFLAAHAHPARSSATRRGKALREVFLCQKVPTPPPNVDFSKLDDPDPSLKTARDRLHVHATNASCAGCHKIMDPMGLALEHFDGAGAYRATEQGAPLDTSGALDGKAFNDADGLARALHDHPALPSCLVNRVYSYATGGPVALAEDRKVLEYFTQRFAVAGYRFPDLLREIAQSDAFLEVRESKSRAATVVSAAGTAVPPVALNRKQPGTERQ
jgi:hypothetical protein